MNPAYFLSNSYTATGNLSTVKLKDLALKRQTMIAKQKELGLNISDIHEDNDIELIVNKKRGVEVSPMHATSVDELPNGNLTPVWDIKRKSYLDAESVTNASTTDTPAGVVSQSRVSVGNIRRAVNDMNDMSNDTISAVWARRLDELSVHHNSYKLDDNKTNNSNNNNSSSSSSSSSNYNNNKSKDTTSLVLKKVHIKPKWPSWLGTLTFEVMKRTDLGSNLKRTLKLTEYHILNIKHNKEISKSYPYVFVQRIWLENSDVVMIQYKNGKQNMYITSVAPHIVQQLATRVRTRNSLEKTKISNNNSIGSAAESSQELANVYTQTMSIMIHNIMQSGADIPGDANKDTTDSTKRDEDDTNANDWTPREIKYDESTMEYKVQKTVQSILFDESNPVGNTRRHFISNFDANVSKVEDVRVFIDGLYEYVLEHNGVDLIKCLLTSGEVNAIKHITDVVTLRNVIDKKKYDTLSYIIFAVAEESVFLPLETKICELIPSAWLKVMFAAICTVI